MVKLGIDNIDKEMKYFEITEGEKEAPKVSF